MQQGWVTSTDARAIRLAFNLFNGAVPTALNKSEDEWDTYMTGRGTSNMISRSCLIAHRCAFSQTMRWAHTLLKA